MENKAPSSDNRRLSRKAPQECIKNCFTGDNPFKGTERSDCMSISYSIAGKEIAAADIGSIELISDTIVMICGKVRKRMNGKNTH